MSKKLQIILVLLSFGLVNLVKAQVANYTFAQGAGSPTLLTATYTQHTSGTTDYAGYTAIPIGFTFNFDCVSYTTVSISNDGYIVMGNSLWNTTTPISSASENNVISALAGDLVGLAGASLRSKTAGTAPNRTFTVEWKNYARWSNGGDITFQIILYETTNVIDMVYVTNTALTTASDFQTGLSGATNADFNNRTKATNTAWTSSTAGGTNAAVMSCGTTTARCPSGLFTWTPPGCSGTPTAGTTAASPSSICASESTNLSITSGAVGCGLTYQWQSSPDNSIWTNIAGATSATYTASPSSNTYYRRRTTCTASGLSANSTSALVSIVSCVIIGTGTSTGTYPYTGGWHDARSQYIILASELTAAGFCGGSSLSSLAFNVSSKNSSAIYNGFTIKLGHTTSANFPSATWLTPTWTNVYSANWTTAVGWNVHSFSTNFTWNGSDNIVVETCFNNTAYTSSDYVYMTNTGSNTVCYNYADNSTGCTMAASSTTALRPNMKFNYIVGPPCSGTPTGGTSAASPNSICVGDNSTLSLSGQTIGCGIILQWQSSPNPVTTWTNIAGATSASYVVSPIVSTNYRCLVTCTNSGLSSPSSVTLVTIPIVVPNCATYNSPTNGATGIICGINAILDWSAPTVTACNPASSYDVYFGTAASPPFVVNQTGLTYNPGTLLPSTTYYWRIVPRNSAGPAVCATVWSFTTGASFSGSQTVPPISDDFENCLDWTIVNGAAVNKWILGSATSNGGTKSMYVNNTGTNNNYAHTASVVHFYKDITLPTGMTTSLAFDWKADGESCCDYLYVSLVPTTYTPTEGTAIPGTYILGNYKFNVQTTWQTFNYNLPSCGGTTMRLVFTWRNDGSVGTQPPAAVDNINIVAVNTTGQTCANPVNIILPYNRTGESTDCMINDYTNASTSSCGTAFESGQDRVYKAVIGVAGCISVNITNANDNSIGFQVYNGCPDVGGTTCIGNFGGAIAGSLAGDINIPAPGTYYFVVDNFAGPTSVNYDISISAPGGNTANDLPCNATAMTLGISSNGDNTCTNATGEPANPACWGTGALNTVWYAITVPASMDVYIRTTAISLLNTQIAAYTTTNCASAAAFTMVGCNVNAPNCGSSTNNTSELLLNNVAPAGTVLYIRVDGFGSLTGSFSILAIDGNNGAATWPTVPGQDCMMSNPVCNATMSVGNPGYFSFGNICDFPTGSTCLASGERSSVWYTININANGNLTFDIVPNDYGNPNPITGQANPGYTTQGSESDYDWALWKISGSGSTTCAGIAGGAAALKCNYNSLGVTGLYGTTNGTNNPAYPGYGAAYQSQQAVLNGEVYILVVSNFANNYVSGFSLVFGGSPPPIAMTATTTSVTWAGTTNTSWNQPGNWSNACSAPNCAIDATITTGGAQPVITANSTVKNLTINAGATLTINAGVTLTVCGNFTNNGTLIASPTSTILFDNASVTHTISGSVTGTNRFGNLTINKTGGSVQLAASTNFEIAGNFTTMNATSILNVNNNYLKIGGNFNTASNVTLTNCPTIEFNGVIPQTFTNTAGTHALTNVVMNNTSSGITLTGTASSNMVLSGALTLTNGVIYTATTPILIMNAGSTATSGSASSFVDGPMQKIGNTAFVFPVGDAFNRWMRIAMTAPTTSSTFQAQYFYTPYSTLTPMAVTPTPVLNNVSAIEYWQFDRIAGTGNASLTLYWQNASSSGINSCAALQGGDLVVARWNGSAWENRSNTITGGITGSCVGTSAGTVTSDPLTAFSPFTFASKTAALNPLPVELISFTGENFGSENILKWTTLTETNNDFFTLERTLNGYTFETLGIVDGSGNSNTRHDYNYIDAHPVEGMNYYRLKQTDFNGDVKYYPELVAINYTKTTDYGLYPNPANNEIMIYTSNSKSETVNIHITDVTGRVMLQESTLTLKEKGLNGSKIDISAYPNGIYFIMINDLNGKPISQKRFVKN